MRGRERTERRRERRIDHLCEREREKKRCKDGVKGERERRESEFV